MSTPVAVGFEVPSAGLRLWSLDEDAIVGGETYIAGIVEIGTVGERDARITVAHPAPFSLYLQQARIHLYRRDAATGNWLRLPTFFPGIVSRIVRRGSGQAEITLAPDHGDEPPRPRFYSHASQTDLYPDDQFFAAAQKWIDQEKVAEFAWPTITRELPGGLIVESLPDTLQPIIIRLPPLVMDTGTTREIGNAKWTDFRRLFPSTVDIRSITVGLASFSVNDDGVGTVSSRSRAGKAVGEYRIRNPRDQVLTIYEQDVFVRASPGIQYHEIERGVEDVLRFSGFDSEFAGNIGISPLTPGIARITRQTASPNTLTVIGDSIGEALVDHSIGIINTQGEVGLLVFRVVPTLPEHLPPSVINDGPVLVSAKDTVFDAGARFDQMARPFNVRVTAPNITALGYIYTHRGGQDILDPVLNGDWPISISATRTPIGAVGPDIPITVRVSGIVPVALPPMLAPATTAGAVTAPRLPGWPTPDFSDSRFTLRFVEEPAPRTVWPTTLLSVLTLQRSGNADFTLDSGGSPETGDVWTGYIRGNDATYRYRVTWPPPLFAVQSVTGQHVSLSTDRRTVRMRVGQVATVHAPAVFRGAPTTGRQHWNPVVGSPEVCTVAYDRTAGTVRVTADQLGQTTIGDRIAFVVEVEAATN